MQYTVRRIVGDSIMHQAHFPGKLRRETMEVLPWGQKGVSHWIAVNCE